MKRVSRILTLSLALLCAGLGVYAQEPADLGNYRIAAIGAGQNTFTTNQWYLMGRNDSLVKAGKATNGYAYSYTGSSSEDKTSSISNAACSSGGEWWLDYWQVEGAGTLSSNTTAVRYNMGDGFTYPYADYFLQSGFTSTSRIYHDQITGLAPGNYRLSVNARAVASPVASNYSYPTKTTSSVLPGNSGTQSGTTFNYNVYSYVGSSYEGKELQVSLSDILASVGASSISDVTIYSEEPNGTRTNSVRGNTDGWRNAEGTFTGWGSDAYFYVQDRWSQKDGEYYTLGGFPGNTGEERSFTAKLVYVNNTTSAEAVVNITLNYFSSITSITAYNYVVESLVGSYYEGKALTVDTEEILSAIGAASMSDVTIYSEEPSGTRTASVRGTTDGWRKADGTFQGWGSDAYFYVQDESTLPGAKYYLGGYPGNTGSAVSYTAKLVYVNNTTSAEIPVNITLKYIDPSASFHYYVRSECGSSYEGKKLDVDQTAILSSIGSPSSFTIYSEAADGTRTTVRGNTDGWRNAKGEFESWGSSAYYYLQDGTDDSGVTYYFLLGGFPGNTDTETAYTTKLVYVNNDDTSKEACVYVTFQYGNAGCPVFYATAANTQGVALTSGTSYRASDGTFYGFYNTAYSLDVNVVDGNLDLGFKFTDDNGTWQWIGFKDIQLTFLGSTTIKMSDGIGDVAVGNNAGDKAQYLVRFVYAGNNSANGDYYKVQLGTAKYFGAPSSAGNPIYPITTAGNYFVYGGEGYLNGVWKKANGVFINSTTDGSDYRFTAKAGDAGADVTVETSNGKWSNLDGDLANLVFTLYPLTLCEQNPTIPSVVLPETSTTSNLKFYRIKHHTESEYATYSDVARALGYMVMGRSEADLNGYSYWWLEEIPQGSEGYQNFYDEGTRKVKMHNAIIPNHALISPIDTLTASGCTYYLLPTQVGANSGIAISRNEYSFMDDSWQRNDYPFDLIGQKSSVSEGRYNTDAALWDFESVAAADVWNAIKTTLKEEMHAGSYLSASVADVNTLFNKADYASADASTFNSKLTSLLTEIRSLATAASVPVRVPLDGGRFYLKSRAVPSRYLADKIDDYIGGTQTLLTVNTITNNVPAACDIWEFIPYGDPLKVTQLRDQPLDNAFTQADYDKLPKKELQRYWIRNRATGKFLCHGHQPMIDGDNTSKNGYDRYGHHFDNNDVSLVNSLDRDTVDIWYLDVVENRNGVRTGVIRTGFLYDSPTGVDTPTDDGMNRFYNYPCVHWDLSQYQTNTWVSDEYKRASIKSWGWTYSDPTRCLSEWLVYDIDTDMPESSTAGINYLFKNTKTGLYAYDSTLGTAHYVQQIDDVTALDDKANGVWTLYAQDDSNNPSGPFDMENQGSQLYYGLIGSDGSTNTKTSSTKYWKSWYLPNSDCEGYEDGFAITNTAGNIDGVTDCWNAQKTINYWYSNVKYSADVVSSGVSSKDLGSVWSLEKLDRRYDDVTYELSKMLVNYDVSNSTKIFYLKNSISDWQTLIETWKTENGGKYPTCDKEYEQYKTIKDILEGKYPDGNFNLPVDGTRYLLQNKETGRYLANYGRLMAVDDPDYYCVWNFSQNAETGTYGNTYYSLTNDGANSAMRTDGAGHTTGAYYLGYDNTKDKDGFVMSDTEQFIRFRPDGAGYARFYSKDESDVDKVAYGPTWGDQLIQSKEANISNSYWTVVPITTDLEKTLFQNSVKNMATYSGGPLTDDLNVSSFVTADITDLTAVKTITTGTASLANYASYINKVWNLTANNYLTWKAGNPLYIENAHRPAECTRLMASTDTLALVTTKDDEAKVQTFMFELDSNSSAYLLKNMEGSKYLAVSTADDAQPVLTTTKDNYATFTVTEVLPGSYSLMDQENRYLTITEDGAITYAAGCGFGSLWKIKCNDYYPITKSLTVTTASPFSSAGETIYATTISNTTDSRIRADVGAIPYYATETSISSDGSILQVKLVEAETSEYNGINYYLMRRNTGYVLVKKTSDAATYAAHDIMLYGVYRGSVDYAGKNLLKAAKELVTAPTRNTYLVLANKSTDTQIGTTYGKPVYGVGLGFYPLKAGGTIAANKAYLPRETFNSYVLNSQGLWTNAVKGEASDILGVEMTFEDSEGNVTEVIDIPASDIDGSDGPVYDLSGRRVLNPTRGLYIVNGKKVMMK